MVKTKRRPFSTNPITTSSIEQAFAVLVDLPEKPTDRDVLLRQAGALADDETLEALRDHIHQNRR